MEQQLIFESKEQFREWLQMNPEAKSIWIVFSKDEALKTMTSEEALLEALCFGWIDGQIQRIDEQRYRKKFAQRGNNSKWSERNKTLVEKLTQEGRMTEQGRKAVEQAKKTGTWNTEKPAPVGEAEIIVLEHAIFGIEPAATNYGNMSPSIQRTYAAHYANAKAEATKERRLQEIIGRLNENKKPM